MRRLWNLMLIVLLSVALAGCGRVSAPPTPAERFKKDQASVVTPHGRIKLETVTETGDGRIGYETTDGSKWTVAYSKDASGSLRYYTPTKSEN